MSKDRLLWILKDASIDADKDGESISDWKREWSATSRKRRFHLQEHCCC